MTLRAFNFPADIPVLIDLIPRTFQYPEHPEWGVQGDSAQNFLDSMNMLRRLWPLLQVVMTISPSTRDAMRGFVWEDGGKFVALANVSRQGTSARGYIANVGVLPEYRRKGIARSLVEACMDLSRTRGDTAVTLDVIAENAPARELYEKLGFEVFTERYEYEYDSADIPVDPALPAGYTLRQLSTWDWKARFELDRAAKPDSVQVYQPVEESAYRPPVMVLPIILLVENASGYNSQFAVYQSDKVVGRAQLSARKKEGGVNNLRLSLHPEHTVIAPHLVRHSLHQLQTTSPGRRVSLSLASWQPELQTAAQDAGFKVETRMLSMGKQFN